MADKDTSIDEVQEVDYTEEGAEEAPDNGQPQESAAQTEAQRLLFGIISNPEVAQILQANRDGKIAKVTVSDTAEPESSPAALEIPEDALEDLDPGIRTVVETISKHIEAQISPLTEKVNKLQLLADGMQKTAMDTQIGKVAGKHKDFEKYRGKMADISRAEGAGLSVEQLYVLAKLQDGDLNLTEPSTHSERPTPTPQRRAVRSKTAGPQVGRKAWQISLGDALDRTLTPEQ